ncbi:hypothetical protein [Nocardia sp. NPDC051981]|uniref:hypothetical protein n=1 Tax=Nocardia sp. NPDC051981 TaxID=3155417 RepID=UPI003438056B
MSWDMWALLSILALCSAVILWSCWGFYRDSHTDHPHTLHLRLTHGGHLDLRLPPGHTTGRHRTRDPQTTKHTRHSVRLLELTP